MKTPWDSFRSRSLGMLLRPGARVIDIGGGLRVLKGRGNRYDAKCAAEFEGALQKITYEIIDPVPDYSPDLVGDIHDLPLANNAVDGIICIAVLEHVENPRKAMSEMLRVVRPGGHVFVYVPFLYYYHAEVGYYKDFWRYTKDSLPLLAEGFSNAEWVPVRGAFETWIHLSPLGRSGPIRVLARVVDQVTGKLHSNQVSGYFGLLTK